MVIWKKIMLLAGVMAVFASPAAYGAGNEGMLVAASETVKVTPTDASGLVKKIAAEKGKVVVINIFASWCPPCRQEAPGLIAARKAFPERDMYMAGVSVDKTPAALHSFLGDYPFNYPMYMAEGKFVETFGVNAIPQLLVYDRQGELVVNHKGLLEADKLHSVIKLVVDHKGSHSELMNRIGKEMDKM